MSLLIFSATPTKATCQGCVSTCQDRVFADNSKLTTFKGVAAGQMQNFRTTADHERKTIHDNSP